MGGGKTHSIVLFGRFVAQYPACQTENSSPSPDMGAATAQLPATPNSSRRGIYPGPLSHRQMKKKVNEAWSIRDSRCRRRG